MPGQRLDKWLWCARLSKTRSGAARLIEAGKVRINGERVLKSSRLVQAGDVVTLAALGRLAVVRMLGRRSENDAVVTEYDPPYRAKIAGTSTNSPFIGTLVFGREGEATHVEVTTELVMHGAARIMGPTVAWWYGRAWTRGLETLRRLMESGEL